MPSPEQVVDFFSSWENYRAVIESDAMEHREIYGAVHRILLERSEPFTLIDLGCGDAAGTGPALRGTQVARYVGVDVAAPALDLARAHLDGLAMDIDLRVCDLTAAMTGGDQTYDVALACFVVHHLPSDEKRALLAAVRERLNDGGELLLVDLVREDGTSRVDFLSVQDARIRTWPIGAALQERTIDHANGFDFPEERSTLARWAAEVGYREVIEFYCGGDGTQAGWRLLR